MSSRVSEQVKRAAAQHSKRKSIRGSLARTARTACTTILLLTALGVSLRRQALGADIKTGRPIDRGEGVDVVGRDLFVAVEVTLVAAVHLCVCVRVRAYACACTCRQQASKRKARPGSETGMRNER